MVRPTLSVVPARGVASAEADDARPVTRQELWDEVQKSLNPVVNGSNWTARAVCVGADADALFVTGAAQREAARICQACPVRLECLADALDNQIEYGVWGGMTERQRRALLKKSPEVPSWRNLLEEARASVTREAAS